MKKYLITGGAGFIGSHLADTLIKRGERVVIIDSLFGSGRQNINPEVKSFNMDINNPEVLNIFEMEKPDIIFYLAGPIHLRRKITDPLFDRGLHVLSGFKKVLDYSCAFKIQKVIFASSGGAIYSGAKAIPTTEEYLAHPVSLYGLANLMFEKVLDEYSKASELRFITLRLSNVYGPRQWKNGVIPSFIEQILGDASPIIHGDGKQTRDFIYVDDVIRALLAAVETEKTGVFNIGSDQEVSLNKLFHEIAGILNKEITPRYRSEDTEKTQRSVLNCSKAREELKWEPRVNLKEGLKRTIDWSLDQVNLTKDRFSVG